MAVQKTIGKKLDFSSHFENYCVDHNVWYIDRKRILCSNDILHKQIEPSVEKLW